MTDKRGVFFDEWQACLRAHYKAVIQDNDTVTEPTLRAVLLQSGLSEDDLRALAEEAHAENPPDSDDMPADVDAHTIEEPTGESDNDQMAMF